MSTDSQGRPLSDDGQWAWNGTEWVPAAGGPAEPAAAAFGAPVEDVGATMIVQSPFPSGAPGASQGDAPSYGSAQTEYGPAAGYGQAPSYAQAPGYGAGTPGVPGSYGIPPPTKSRKSLIIAIIGVLLIAAVVVVLIVVLGDSSKKDPTGAFKCTAPGTTATITVTFATGQTYSLTDGGTGGKYTRKGNALTFTSGGIKDAHGQLSNGGKTITVTDGSATVTCKK
jgi:hypothetical protein